MNAMTNSQKRTAILVVLIPVTLALHSYSHLWITLPGQSNFMNHVLSDLCYIPIILAAIWFGIRGAVISTTIVAVFFFLFVIFYPPESSHELTSDYVEIVILFLIGGFSGMALDKDRHLRKKLDEIQRHAAVYNRSLIESSLDPLVTIGLDGKITDVNLATETVTGLKRNDLVGTDFSNYFTEPGKARSGYQEVFREGTVRDYPLEIRHQDGHITSVLYNASLYRDETGKVTGVFAAARDITARKKAEDNLRESQRRLELALKGGDMGFWDWDMRTAGAIVSDRWTEMLELDLPNNWISFADFLGIIHPDDREMVNEKATAHLEGKTEFYDAEFRCVTKSGVVKWINSRGQVVEKDPEGKPFRFIGTHLDITERKKTEEERRESEERFRALFKNMTNSVALWEIIEDETGRPYDARFLEINPAFEEMTGFKRREIIGNTISNIFPEFGRDWYNTVGKVARGGQPIRMVQTIKRIGKTFITSVYSPSPGQCAVIREDITDRIKAEEEVRNLNKELEQRVVDRTAQLETTNKELESFSYTVSHDLRAPLRAIDGFSRIILEDYYDKLDDEGKRLLNVICKNTQDMGKLIDDLLAFSRTGRQKMKLSCIDMNTLARKTFEDVKASAPERNIVFEVQEPPPVYGDTALMRQALINLISNSVKFTRSRDRALIEFGGRIDSGENVYYLKDNGVGFDMQYVDKIFGVFQRLHKDSEFEGTGVGLAIVQRVIQMHGGRIWAEGKIGEGSIFYFTLPNKT